MYENKFSEHLTTPKQKWHCTTERGAIVLQLPDMAESAIPYPHYFGPHYDVTG